MEGGLTGQEELTEQEYRTALRTLVLLVHELVVKDERRKHRELARRAR